MGAARRRREQRLPAAVPGQPGQEEEGSRAEAAAGRRRRALPRHRPRPRGRGHRLAPARSAQAEGARAAHGVPRDHQAGDPRGRQQHPRARPEPGRRAGGPPHPRPPLRLRGLAGAVEESHAAAVRRPRAVRGHTRHRRARARAHGVHLRRLLGPRRDAGHRVRARRPHPAAPLRRPPVGRRGQARRRRPRLRRPRPAEEARGRHRPARGRRPFACRRTDRRDPAGRLRRGEAVHPPALPAVHDVDAAAGGRAQAPLHLRAHHAHRPAPVRKRPHHLHANRLDDAVEVGHRGRAPPGVGALRPRVRRRRAAPVSAQGQELAGGPRGHPPRRRAFRHARRAGRCPGRRGVQALRADLAAHRRLPDDRRARHVDEGHRRRHVRDRRR